MVLPVPAKRKRLLWVRIGTDRPVNGSLAQLRFRRAVRGDRPDGGACLPSVARPRVSGGLVGPASVRRQGRSRTLLLRLRVSHAPLCGAQFTLTGPKGRTYARGTAGIVRSSQVIGVVRLRKLRRGTLPPARGLARCWRVARRGALYREVPPAMTKLHMTRRELVASLVATGAVAAVPPAWAKQLLPAKRRIGPGAFNDGVASGEPSSTAVTFWSRLETSRPRSGARLVVATDPGMRRVVAHTTVPTGRGVNGALKARVGGLKPHTEYYYVWESGTGVSPIGRTRTAPPPGSAQPLLLASSSCQSYGVGYYNAHADAAALADLDVYMFLGDYIYEAQGTQGRAARRRDPGGRPCAPTARSTRSTAATRTCASCTACTPCS